MKHTRKTKSSLLTTTGTVLSILLCTLSLHAENDSTTLPDNNRQQAATAAVLPIADTLSSASGTHTDIPDQSDATARQPIGTDTLLFANDAAPSDSIPGDSSIQSDTDTLHEVSIGTVIDDTAAVVTSGTSAGVSTGTSSEKQSYSPIYRGITRGVRAPVSTPPATAETARQSDSLQGQPTTASPVSDATTVKEPPAALSDSKPAEPEQPVTATNAALQKLDKRTKILVAAGTSAAILGTAVFILVKQFNDDRSQKDGGIPDPPDPPGYW